MINTSAIQVTLPPVTTPAVVLTTMAIGQESVERKDLSSSLTTGATLTTMKETKNTIARRMVKVVHPFVNVDPNISLATPYNVNAHLVITSDERFVTSENLVIVLGELLGWALQEEVTGSGQNVLRLAKGEL